MGKTIYSDANLEKTVSISIPTPPPGNLQAKEHLPETLEAAHTTEGSTATQCCLSVQFSPDQRIPFVLDTGCSANVLRPSAYHDLQRYEIKREPFRKINFTNIQGVKSQRIGFVTFLSMPLGQQTYNIPFFVFDTNEFKKNYLGMRFMEITQAVINFATMELQLGKDKIRFEKLQHTEIVELSAVSINEGDKVEDDLKFSSKALEWYKDVQSLKQKI